MKSGATRVKVCCISSPDEARAAIAAGASALGLVSEMPSGPGVISEELITQIVATVPPGVATFLLTSATEAEAILDQQRRTRASCIQLVDLVSSNVRVELRRRLPGIHIIQVVHVTGPEALDAAREAAISADAILLDSGNPDAPTRELGGTGRVHNWDLSREIVREIEPPVFLAGGLHPNNVRRAIEHVGPYGVDLCSGLRTDGLLDHDKLEAFFREVRAASTHGVPLH